MDEGQSQSFDALAQLIIASPSRTALTLQTTVLSTASLASVLIMRRGYLPPPPQQPQGSNSAACPLFFSCFPFYRLFPFYLYFVYFLSQIGLLFLLFFAFGV